MSIGSYRFMVGGLECVAVADGSNTYEVGPLFTNAPADELRQVLEESALSSGELEIPYTCLAVKAEGSWLLIDTGRGTSGGPGVGKLVQNLHREGIDPADVETVILTHGHRDHIGGITDGEGQLAFPKARYIMGKEEWSFWTTEEKLIEMGWEGVIPFMRSKLLPIEGNVELIGEEKELGAGVRVIPAAGHTPGHMVVAISSGGEELWSTGDALIHPVHLERLGWYTAFDLKPGQALGAKRWVLGEVSDREAWVHAFHFPFPGIGRTIRVGEGWQWQPVGER
jgi:glyoxylase-like metal-dependent hydrolase (beta-lactamase superfamily II)